jgi:hypothetical protein
MKKTKLIRKPPRCKNAKRGERMAPDETIDATFENLSKFKDSDIDWIVTEEQMRTILENSGYSIGKDNLIKDKKTGEPVLAEDGLPINVTKDKKFALIGGGSHHFVRNVVDYSTYLLNNNLIKIVTEASKSRG